MKHQRPSDTPATGVKSTSGSTTATRKRSKAMNLEEQCKMLEDENLSLRLQLKVGKETLKQDEQKRDDLLNRIEALVNNPSSSEEELQSVLKSYVVRYSDCSADHADQVDNHMVLIQKLLAPTKVTKLCLWALNQDDDFFKPVLSPHESLFQIIVDEVEATLDQTEEFKNYRQNSRLLTRGLRHSDRECEDLRQRLKRKNRALTEEMHELQDILTPRQFCKLIIWANRDPRVNEVLKREWVGWSDPSLDELRAENDKNRNGDVQKDLHPPNVKEENDDLLMG